MKVVSEKRFPIRLKKAGHYSITLEEGILVELEWEYDYGMGPITPLTKGEASRIKRQGGAPWEIWARPGDKKCWAISKIGQRWVHASICVYHYGQKVQNYASPPQGKQTDLNELEANGSYELPIGNSVVRLARGGKKITRTKGQVFGKYTHPKEIIVQLLQ